MQIITRLLPLFAVANALVPAPRMEPGDFDDINLDELSEAMHFEAERGLGTSADMYFFNDWPNPVEFTTSDHKRMSDKPPKSVSLNSYSASSKYSIEANGWIPIQSKFKVQMKAAQESKMDVDIGMTPWKTGFKRDGSNPAFQSGAMLAPAKPLSKGRDFDFFFFSGPGILPPLINSALDANLPAIFANIKAKPMTIKVNDDIDIELREFKNMNVKSSYASVTPASDSVFNINAILDVDAEIKVKARYKKLKQDATIKIKGLSVLVGATADLTGITSANLADPSNVGLTVTRFQTSIQGIDLDGDILVEIVGFLYPVLAPALRLPYTLAAIINQSENQNIINMINAAIKSMLPASKPSTLHKRFSFFSSLGDIFSGLTGFFSFNGGRTSQNPPGTVSKPTTTQSGTEPTYSARNHDHWPGRPSRRGLPDMSTWMSTPSIQSSKLFDLHIPATHDSHAWDFDDALSLMKYPEIAFLWGFEYFNNAPADGTFDPLKDSPIHLGAVLGKYVMTSVSHISKAQGQDLTGQLNGGVRHFDLRVYYDPADDTFHTQHGLRAKPRLSDLVAQVKGYLESKQGGQELVIIDISHTNMKRDFTLPDGSTLTASQCQLKMMEVLRPLEPWVYMPANAKGISGYNLDTLKDTVLSDITQGNNKVLLMTPDFTLPELAVNTDGWDYIPAQGTVDAGLWEISTAAALGAPEIVSNVLKGLSGRGEDWVLAEHAKINNAGIKTLVQETEARIGSKIQLVSVDFYEYGADGKSAAQLIVELNGA